MAVQGKQKENKEFEKKLFIGFTSIKPVAFNPTRSQLNELFGKEDKEDDKPIDYLGQDTDGNQRVRMAFWLKDESNNEFYPYSFNIVKKERKNKDGDKVQVINSTCGTTWVPLTDKDEPNDDLIPEWFKNFISKDKEVLGKKKYRKALSGEEELGTFMKQWLGRLNFNDPDTEVLVDTDKLFKGKFDEIQSLIDGDYDTPFVILLGVRTDPDDSTKKYQQVYGKEFLPNGFLKYIQNGMKFPSDYSKKVWKKFEEQVSGEYGFNCFHELVPLKEYNPAEDITSSMSAKVVDSSSGDY